MRHQPTSIRFSPDELELIAAIGGHLTAHTGVPYGRSDTIRAALKHYPVPAGDGPVEQRLRRAHQLIYNRSGVNP